MPEAKRPLKVFLCHAHADKLKTRELYRYLRKRGIQPWLDAEDLVGGQDWRVEIPKAIKVSDTIIICLSKNSINKEGFVQAEISFALEKALEIPSGRIFIIPARFEDCDVPDKLERYHWVDLFEEDGFPRLMKSLKTRASQLERATVEVPKPDESSPNLTSASEEKNSLEDANREAFEKDAHEKAELEATKKVAREKIEQEAAKKAVREKAEREKAEKAKRKKVVRQTARKAAIASFFSNVKPFLKVIGIFGIVIVLFWGGSFLISKFIPPVRVMPTVMPTGAEFIPTKVLTSTPYAGSLDVEIADTKNVPMVLVPAGEFTMGSDQQKNEQPISPIYLDNYYIDKLEVTNEMYKLCVEDKEHPCGLPSPSRTYNDPLYQQRPVVFVSWYMAKVYCEWRGASLPTEAQWEKAARGTNARTYPWGEDIDKTYANYGDYESGTVGVSFYEKGRSPYGAYNMAGNVWEWTSSLNKPYPYNAEDGREDLSAAGMRVARGGSWNSSQNSVRTTNREFFDPASGFFHIGFRCARSVP